MFSHTFYTRARQALATSLAISLLAASTPAYALNMWYCGIASQAFADKNSWGLNDACGINAAAAPGADDTVILDKSAAGRVVVMSGSTSIKGLILAKSFTGTLKQMSLLKISSGSGGFKMGSGRFVGGAFPMTLSGSLTMSGGIMNGLQSVFTITGSLALSRTGNIAGGSIAPPSVDPTSYASYSQFTSTGTVVMAGSLANQNLSINSNVLRRLNNLKINNRKGGTSDNVIVAASGSLALSGALTVMLGTLDLATKNTPLQVQRSVTVADSAQAEIMTDQNMTMSGAVAFGTAGLLTVSGGTLTLTGNHDQAVNIQGQRLYNLTINNNGGTISATDDDVTFAGGALNMSGALTITLGNLDLLSNTLAAVVKGGGITIANTAQATLDAGGNITMSGSLAVGDAASFSIPLTATLKVNGVGADIDTNNTALLNLTVNSASGARLTSPQRVFGTLTIGTGGKLSMNGFTLSATGATIRNYGSIVQTTGKIVHSGSIVMTNAALSEISGIKPPTPLFFVVTDGDQNTDGTAQDTLTISASVAASGDTETVTLTESTKNSGVFVGSVSTGNGTGVAGVLQATADSTVTSTFTDAQDALVATDTTAFTVFTAATTGSTGTSGGGSGGGGGGGGRSYLKTTVPAVPAVPGVAPAIPAVPNMNALTRREAAEKAKQLRLEKRKNAMELRKQRLEARKAKHGK